MSEFNERSRAYATAQTDAQMVYIEAERRVKELKSENAKLRELATRFADYVGQDRCEGCVTKTRCNEGLIDECWLLTEIREIADGLGIEVEE